MEGLGNSGHYHQEPGCSSSSSKPRRSIDGTRHTRMESYSSTDEDIENCTASDQSVESTTLLVGSDSRGRRPFQARWNTPKEDFYIRVVDAFNGWRKTRRKTWRTFGRFVYTLLRELFFSKWTIKLQIILLITSFVLTLVFTIHIYHHSHFDPYPWRQHCASQPSFPMERYVEEEPVGILVGVMTMAGEEAAQRRNEIRESWASHWASRGHWEEGKVWSQSEIDPTLRKNIMNPTSRVVVRFVMGWPRPEYRAAIKAEIKEYNDIVLLPIRENMNDGKTFALFDWSFKHALVPPPNNQTGTSQLAPLASTSQNLGYDIRNGRYNETDDGKPHRHGWSQFKSFEAMPPASHDPLAADGKPFTDKESWVRPDYIVKVDDDSFVMLAELEARLRVLPRKGVYWGYPVRAGGAHFHAGEAYGLSWDLVGHVSTFAHRNRGRTMFTSVTSETTYDGQEIATSTDNTDKRNWVDADGAAETSSANPVPTPRRSRNRQWSNLALPISGREDQVTSWWMKDHGEEWGVTWYDELCWIYDHPKATTVYSKGFLFPQEVDRIKDEWSSGLRAGLLSEARKTGQAKHKSRPEYKRLYDATYSTVLRAYYRYSYPFAPKYDTLYRSPLPSIDPNYLDDHAVRIRREMENVALIEGSELSMLVPGLDDDQEIARRWRQDLGRGWKWRYLLDAPSGNPEARRPRIPIGGTVVVHFAKKVEQWRDCVDILLEGWTREQALKSSAGSI